MDNLEPVKERVKVFIISYVCNKNPDMKGEFRDPYLEGESADSIEEAAKIYNNSRLDKYPVFEKEDVISTKADVVYDGDLVRMTYETVSDPDKKEFGKGFRTDRTELVFSRNNPRKITIIKKGEINGIIVIEKNIRHYTTLKIGGMELHACYDGIDVNCGVPAGTEFIYLDYFLEYNGAAKQRHKISVARFMEG